ncbi:MAG: GIY-YIG nuclease family protein [Betaproteobacteria bacterium]|nr:GIY-YIG nuclease family protein [Betaproteobacteria bacterium]
MAKGFVYILRNEAMPGLLKIGYSVKVPTERVDELFTTGVPEPFKLAYYCLAENADKLESAIHRNLAVHRHSGNREFFRIDLESAVKSICNLCKPEHQWFEESIRPVALVAGCGQSSSFHGISVTSRDDDDGEMQQMANFVEAAHKRSLTPFVRSLFYDSNSRCCYFELSDEVEQFGPIEKRLLEIALETIGQFEWFGQIRHGVNRDDSDEF